MKQRRTTVSSFLQNKAIFTGDEFKTFLTGRGSANPRTRESLLRYYRDRGAIVQIRRGLYCSVPPGAPPGDCPVDSYLLAAKLSVDAVLAYHTALELHGRSYSVQQRVVYVTRKKSAGSIFRFRGVVYRAVSPPTSLGTSQPGVQNVDRAGQPIRVTSLERTLVDVLDRPHLSGGLEEVWRSLEMIPFLDLDQTVDYALRLGKSTTIGRVGFFLAQHRELMMVDDDHLSRLRKHRPRSPKYLTGKPTSGGRLVSEWNLVVPETVLRRAWEEPA